MRLFVGYGYDQRDQWVEELVFPLLNAMKCEVVHGKVMYGDSLAPAIRSTILSCDALVGFMTRREQVGEKWTTHRWVIEELATAFGRIPVVEVREEGVEYQLGMLGGIQHIVYEANRRDRCLVDIAQAISRISETVSHTTFRLEPSEFVTQFRSLINKPGVKCAYRVMRRNVESEFRNATIWRVAGGLSISVDALRTGDLIQLCVSYGDQSWSSDYEPIDAIRIALMKENL
jgi:hypothetical protein